MIEMMELQLMAKDARDMEHVGRVEQAIDAGYSRDVVRRKRSKKCDLKKMLGTLETSEKSENVACGAMDTGNRRTTELGSVSDASTHTLQAMRTARTT